MTKWWPRWFDVDIPERGCCDDLAGSLGHWPLERAEEGFATLKTLPSAAVVSADVAPDLPNGWPTASDFHRRWLDDVAQSGFATLGQASASDSGSRA